MRNYNKLLILFFLAQILSSQPILSAYGEDQPVIATPDPFDFFNSEYFIVYYRPSADLKVLERNLNKKTIGLDTASSYSETNPEKEIAKRLDQLFEKVEDILGMHQKLPKIHIRVLKDREELNGEYFKLFGNRADLKSFYIDKYNTIYTSETDIDDSVISHEMAHVIINRRYSSILPETISEILASYVDMQLSMQ